MFSNWWKKEDAVHRPTDELFGKTTLARIANIPAFIVKHAPARSEGTDRNLSFVEDVIVALSHAKLGISKVATPAIWNIDNLLREGRGGTAGRRRLRKPKTDLYVELMHRGELSLIFEPDTQDFVAENLYYLPYYSGRPINEIFYVPGFSKYAGWASADGTDRWDAAMAFHILRTLKDAIDEIAKDASEYCEVRMGARLHLCADGSIQRLARWELMSDKEKEARDRAREAHEIDKDLASVAARYGMSAEALLAHIDLRRSEKPVPTYGRIERELCLPEKADEPLLAVAKRIRKTLSRREEIVALLRGSSYSVSDR